MIPRTITAALLLAAVLAAGSASARPTATEAEGSVRGRVVDPSGRTVPGARVALLSAGNSELEAVVTGDDGRFAFEGLAPAGYLVAVSKAGFEDALRGVSVGEHGAGALEITLGLGRWGETVTVTPARGAVQALRDSPQSVTVVTGARMAERGMSILPRALSEETGIHVQQTTTSQGSPFVRGLTGQHVVALVDGVRFNTCTFRPGANQYTALIPPEFVERAEVVRGPSAAQYGSDSLGGALNVITKRTPGAGTGALHGSLAAAFGTADRSASGSLFGGIAQPRWDAVVEASGLDARDVRPGRGKDSHSVATRLLGLPSSVLGSRLAATGFGRYGARAKAGVRPAQGQSLTFQYLRGSERGASRYDQLNGGTGNLINEFDPQTLDFASARYEVVRAGVFDTLSATVSFNDQRDDRRYQSVNNTKLGLRSPISTERNRATAMGYQAQVGRLLGGDHAVVAGAELYDERVASSRADAAYDLHTGGFTDVSFSRPRYPDGARYRTTGLFLQDVYRPHARLTATGAVRYSHFRYSQPGTSGASPSPAYDTGFGDVTFDAGVAYALTGALTLTASVRRGFRAPNVNDFGSIGLSGLGFEVSPDEGIRLAGRVAPLGSAGAMPFEALPAVGGLAPESLMNYEAGARLQAGPLSLAASLFDSEIDHLIERRTIVLPAGSVGSTIGDQPIVRQDASGLVYTALSNSAVFVRTNAGRVRLRGFDATWSLRPTPALTVSGNISSVRGRDLVTGLPPNLENGIPPTHGFTGFRWDLAGRRSWVEVYSLFAFAQRRFSSNDLEQARIGGIRTRQEITNFFNNGAVALGLVRDGRVVTTGETLSEVLARVIGPDAGARVPLYTHNPAFATVNVRGGFRAGRHATVTLIVENVLDANYRLMGSGIDGSGTNVIGRLSIAF